MPRLLSEVPDYVFTAISALGALLLAQFIYVLLRDYESAVIAFGAGLFIFLLIVYRRVDFWRIDSLTHLSAWIALGIIPTLLVYGLTSSPDAGKRIGSYFTGIGEFRCETLPDQSRACLNTNSVVRYVFSATARNVELISGEASFEVQNDRRPFDVASGGLLIHDMSTAFDVYRKPDSTLVTVTEGRVRVVAMDRELRRNFDLGRPEHAWKTGRELARLEQAKLDEITGSLQVLPGISEGQLSQQLAWQEGRIDLTDLTLQQAVEEFSRYQPATRFRFSDLSLTRIRVAGTMDAGNLDAFLSTLDREFQVHSSITQTGDETLITLSRKNRRSSSSHQ